MLRGRWGSRWSAAALLAAAVAVAPGCTLLDDILPGTPFTPDQPKAEVTVVGAINVDRSRGGVDCPSGRTLLWGTARNTGDLDVDDVTITIDVLDGNRNVLGSATAHVFNGQVSGGTTPEEVQVAGTSLAVDESGTFAACSGVPAGAIAATAYRTDFIVIAEIPVQ